MADSLIEIIADGLVVPIALIAAYVLLFKVKNSQKYEAYCRILLAGLTAFMFAKLIGTIYQPEAARPFEQLGLEPGASFLNNPGFPSDHALFVTAITLAVWFETRMKKTTILLAVLAAAVCIGRVLALVHTPLDVIGGVLVACLGIVWYLNAPSIRKKHKANV